MPQASDVGRVAENLRLGCPDKSRFVKIWLGPHGYLPQIFLARHGYVWVVVQGPTAVIASSAAIGAHVRAPSVICEQAFGRFEDQWRVAWFKSMVLGWTFETDQAAVAGGGGGGGNAALLTQEVL